MSGGVVLLHGWPGAPSDYDAVVARLGDAAGPVLVPDLFGPRHADASADAFAHRLVEQLAAAGMVRPVLVGYDVGSRIGQALLRLAPNAVAGAVLSPPYPGVGERFLAADRVGEAWYRYLHRLPLAEELLDGNPAAVEVYLRHFWAHWAGSDDLTARPAFADVVARYSEPGAMTAGFAWYRQNTSYAAAEPISTRTIVLWPELDPLFPPDWADAIGDWFTDVDLRILPGVGHFVPLEAPDAVVEAVLSLLPAAA
jgi:pimeloyl-ACP methyl ester carboxylesterase